MRRICTLCERTSEDGNLWCQEYDCPAETMPIVFSYGQFLGDVKIIRLIKVLRTAALYEALRNEEKVFLKVAHQGCENQLRREADILRQLQGNEIKLAYTGLPVLLPAYHESTLERHPYGKAIVEEETLYYEVFQYIEGELLRDILIKNPQPWYEHVAWLTISLADTLAFLNSLKRLHLSLNPDVILVRTDLDGIYRPVLFDLGLLVEETRVEQLQWLHYYNLPAYTAPELTYTTPDSIQKCLPATPASDVYGLGILFYEMLSGHPVHEYKLRRDSQVREAVRAHKPPPLTRRDLPDEIHIIVERAISMLPRERYPDIPSFTHELRHYFGSVPAEKKRRPANQRLIIGVTLGAIAISLLILVGAFLS